MFKITEAEKKEIQGIFIRLGALKNLMEKLENESAIRIVTEQYIEAKTDYDTWFTDFEKKNNTVGDADSYWMVDFAKNQVELRKN